MTEEFVPSHSNEEEQIFPCSCYLDMKYLDLLVELMSAEKEKLEKLELKDFSDKEQAILRRRLHCCFLLENIMKGIFNKGIGSIKFYAGIKYVETESGLKSICVGLDDQGRTSYPDYPWIDKDDTIRLPEKT